MTLLPFSFLPAVLIADPSLNFINNSFPQLTLKTAHFFSSATANSIKLRLADDGKSIILATHVQSIFIAIYQKGNH